MPMVERPLGVGAYDVRAVCNGSIYPIDIAESGWTRAGEEGDEVVLGLFHGCEFVGENLPAQWRKGWSAGMDADQTFVAKIEGGSLKMLGEADVAGTYGQGWIDSVLPLPLMHDLKVTAELEAPISDTGATADRDISMRFILRGHWGVDDPIGSETDSILVGYYIDEDGLIYRVYKKIDDAFTLLWEGSNYDANNGRSETAEKLTIWRFVFHEADEDTPYRHMHVYLRQSDDSEEIDGADENELIDSTGDQDSPFDISDVKFKMAYPAYQIASQNTSYFDNGYEAVSKYVRVEYPYFEVKKGQSIADMEKGGVRIYDGDPDYGDGYEVLGLDHVFADDVYVRNGLITLQILENTNNGCRLWWWTGALWTMKAAIKPYQDVGLYYPHFREILHLSPERVTVRVRMSGVGPTDTDYADYDITMRRGSYIISFEIREVFPVGDHTFEVKASGLTNLIAYVGDDEVGDENLSIQAQNPAMSDCFAILQTVNQTGLLLFSAEREPTVDFRTGTGYDSLSPYRLSYTEIPQTIHVAVIPFAKSANLFEECEDASTTGQVTADGSASGGYAVVLDTFTEYVRHTVIGVTDLPVGRYRVLVKARDTNQVPMDLRFYVENMTDGDYLNEDNSYLHFLTLTAVYDYYGQVFDITEECYGDTIRIELLKATSDSNSIYVDYITIFYLGDGKSGPQDVAHSVALIAEMERAVMS